MMRFKESICPKCKNELQVDSTKTIATCPFCGTNYDVINTINKKDELLKQKIYQETKENDNYAKKVRCSTKNNDEKKDVSQTLISIIIIAMIIGSCLILAFVYPKQDKDEANQPNIGVESTQSIAEDISNEYETANVAIGKKIKKATKEETLSNAQAQPIDENGKDIGEQNPEDRIFSMVETYVVEEDDSITKNQEDGSQQELQRENGDFKLGENPTVSLENDINELVDSLFSIVKPMLLFLIMCKFIGFVISFKNEDVDGIFNSLSAMLLILAILAIIKFVIMRT